MPNGKVCTGFSKPWVAKYNANAGIITYTGAMPLARGVSVSVEAESSDDNNFYADNVLAESASGVFTGGSATLTVDGLFIAAERFIMGLPEAGADGFTAYGDDQQAPEMGIGFIVRYMSGGVTTYVPTILVKTKFQVPSTEAATQEEEIDWQTQELGATIMRGDDSNHNWKYVGADYTTEDAAETALKKKLGVTITYTVTQTLNAVTSSFDGESVAENAPLEITLTAPTGYNLETPIVIMGELDITSQAWDSATGKISIAAVSGNVLITAEAKLPHATLTVTNHIIDMGVFFTFAYKDAYGSAKTITLTSETGGVVDTAIEVAAGENVSITTDAGASTEYSLLKGSTPTAIGTGAACAFTMPTADSGFTVQSNTGYNTRIIANPTGGMAEFAASNFTVA